MKRVLLILSVLIFIFTACTPVPGGNDSTVEPVTPVTPTTPTTPTEPVTPVTPVTPTDLNVHLDLFDISRSDLTGYFTVDAASRTLHVHYTYRYSTYDCSGTILDLIDGVAAYNRTQPDACGYNPHYVFLVQTDNGNYLVVYGVPTYDSTNYRAGIDSLPVSITSLSSSLLSPSETRRTIGIYQYKFY